MSMGLGGRQTSLLLGLRFSFELENNLRASFNSRLVLQSCFTPCAGIRNSQWCCCAAGALGNCCVAQCPIQKEETKRLMYFMLHKAEAEASLQFRCNVVPMVYHSKVVLALVCPYGGLELDWDFVRRGGSTKDILI